MLDIKKDFYNSSVLNIFTVVICKSCSSFHLPQYLKKELLPPFLCLLPVFPFSQQMVPLVKKQNQQQIF